MLIRNQREQRHVLKGQGDWWLWKAIGQQCSEGNNCGFLHDANKRAKLTTQPAPSPEQSKSQDVKDSAKAKSPRGRSPSGRFHRMPCCKIGEKCAFAHRRLEEQPRKRSERSGDKSAVALLKETKNLG